MEPDPCEEASAGRIVLTHDEWLFSNKGFSECSDTAAFLRNVSEWLRKCNRQTGNKFPAFSKEFSLNESGLAQVLSNSGYTFTVGLDFDPSINNLKKYDWIYLAGPPGDLDSATFSSLMERYVNEGGNLLIAGGTGSFDNTHKGEAVFFNPFLQKFGLKYSGENNRLEGTNSVIRDHELFDGVSELYYRYGNPIVLIDDKGGRAKLLQQEDGDARFAIYDGSIK